MLWWITAAWGYLVKRRADRKNPSPEKHDQLFDKWVSVGWIRERFEAINTELRDLRQRVRLLEIARGPESFKIVQIDERGNMSNTILGIPAGGKGSFALVNVPAGTQVPPGKVPTWVSDSALAVVTPAADGLSATVAVDPTATVGASFNLSASYVRADGTTCAGSAAVPILAAVPPPPTEPTSFDINQTA